MEVVLLEDVKALGKKGQVVKVNDGYARNFILPKKLGVDATSKNLNDLKLQKANAEKVEAEQLVEDKKLAEEIDKRAAQHGITMDILIQVNSAQEESKFGITTGETGQMIRDILASCPHVRIRGLMCIAPFEDNPEDAGQYFAAVKALYDEYAKMQHPNLDFI